MNFLLRYFSFIAENMLAKIRSLKLGVRFGGFEQRYLAMVSDYG
jgi:hypothetical protein